MNRTAKTKEDQTLIKERGVLFGSGLIAGEGIVGVLIAGYAFAAGRPQGLGLIWSEPWGQIVSLIIFSLLVLLLVRKTRVNP